jgi:hypothetical protein
MRYLFPNFLTNSEEFEDARDYWHKLCQDIMSKYHEQQNWQKWLNDQINDGEILDNFPICSLINRGRTKGVVINQQDPEYHTKWEVSAWVKTCERQANEFWAEEYLVFNCNLTEENAQIFKGLFEAWIQPDCDRMQLEKLISEILPN